MGKQTKTKNKKNEIKVIIKDEKELSRRLSLEIRRLVRGF